MSGILAIMSGKLSLTLVLFFVCESHILSQQVTHLRANHTSGQTFLFWTEVALPEYRYRIYRSSLPITVSADLDQADLLGEVDDESSLNHRRTLAELGGDLFWVIPPGITLLPEQGLFVYTTENDGPAWYAVTAVSPSSGEDTSIIPGTNATDSVLVEIATPPQPVLQNHAPPEETWAHWVSNRGTPFQEAMALEPSLGFNFKIRRSQQSGQHGLLLKSHARGSHYARTFPADALLPNDISVLAPDDPFENPQNTFWLGLHDDFPAAATSKNTVFTFTHARVLWTLDWALQYLGSSIDPGRIYVSGRSMGAIGSVRLMEARPRQFAAALCNVGLYDFTVSDIGGIQNDVETLWGSIALNLPTDLGLPVYQRTSTPFMALFDLGQDWPMVRTIQGKNDAVVGWESVPVLIDAMRSALKPDAHYFDQRDHSGAGYWDPLLSDLIDRTFEHRSDKPLLRFSDLSLDDNPGDGAPTDGDPVGCINGYVDYDRVTINETSTHVSFVVSLRNEGALDDAPTNSATVKLTPRRTQEFHPVVHSLVHYELTEGGVLKDEHLLQVNANGLLETPATPLTTAARQARFTLFPAPPVPYLFVGDAPKVHDDLQYFVFGDPLTPFFLYRARFPGGSYQLFAQGTLDARGWANVSVLLDDLTLSGVSLRFQARVGFRTSNTVVITIQ